MGFRLTFGVREGVGSFYFVECWYRCALVGSTVRRYGGILFGFKFLCFVYGYGYGYVFILVIF